jgi:hypothetical protein
VNVDVFAPGVKFMQQHQMTLTNIYKELRLPNVAGVAAIIFLLPNINSIARNTF